MATFHVSGQSEGIEQTGSSHFSILYRKCIGKTQWCADNPMIYDLQKIGVNLNIHIRATSKFKITTLTICGCLQTVAIFLNDM